MKNYYSISPELGSEEELLLYPLAAEETENGQILLSVELSYKEETRICLYERQENSWTWLDGDNEPPMSSAILQLFHGEAGDHALEWCLAHA